MPNSNLPVPSGLSDAMKAALLGHQAAAVDKIALPRVDVMAQGVGLFEFRDSNPSVTVPEITGVILHFRPQFTLWDVPVNEEAEGESTAPACSSFDGQYGTPRDDFAHIGNVLDDGTVECRPCPYNQWQSSHLVNRQGRGKACANSRVLYLSLEDYKVPVQLRLSPTSVKSFDEYLAMLLGKGTPVQTVATTLTLERAEKGKLRWSKVNFSKQRDLMGEEIVHVLSQRDRFGDAMYLTPLITESRDEDDPDHPDLDDVSLDGDDEPPF